MSEEEFKKIAVSVWDAIPDRFKKRVENVALLVEDEPSDAVRSEEELTDDETLLGLYQGIPLTERGGEYGIGTVVPDTITFYRLPLIKEAKEMNQAFPDALRTVIQETMWHEIGHYFGLPEGRITEREEEGSNAFRN
jgi:predicted Zn-dependent protease with MMP-like domain